MIDELKGIRATVDAMDERLACVSGNSSAAIHINGSGALAIAGLWVSALLLVIAAAMAFVCWQRAEHLSSENERLNARVDMLEARTFAAEAAIRQLRKPAP